MTPRIPLNPRDLIEAATPLPWEVRDARNERGNIEAVLVADPTNERVDGVVAATGEFPDRQAKPDARLIEYAVNRLTDYEAAVDLLIENTDALVSWQRENGQGAIADDIVAELDRLLARLRNGADR